MSTVGEDRKSSNGLWLKTYEVPSGRCVTKSASTWYNMRKRCRLAEKGDVKHVAYTGCFMSENFKNFQYFADWYSKQIGYNGLGYALDKDILCKGNREYGEKYCVLVPRELNTFFCANDATRGEYPQGVHYYKNQNSFMVVIRSNNERKFIGYYKTSEEAFDVYKMHKEAEARKWYKRLKSGEFSVDHRVVEKMRTWTLV